MSILYTLFGKMLLIIYELVGSYGIAIIIFAIIAKLILLPITIKQTKSMQETTKLQPEIQKLQKKYANNKEKLNEETMKLYQEHGVNPMASCLPLLIQLPIIYGLFTVLREPAKYVFVTEGSYELVNQHFLWLPSLGQSDPWYIIPVLAAVTTYFYMTNTPTQAAGNDQAKSINNSMKFMSPLMIGYVAWISPSGLGLYWIIQNILTYVQQAILFRGKKDPEGGV